jgi:hypothetical protein
MTSPLKIELFHPIRIPPELPTEGEKANLLKRLGASFFYERVIEILSLGFLNTKNCTRALIIFFFYCTAFIFRIDTSDVPI